MAGDCFSTGASIIRPFQLTRRRFLTVAGGAAAYVVLRPHLGWAKRAAEGMTPLQPWAVPSDPPGNPIELARALIGAAVLAPSNWNAQPWRFEVEPGAIRLVADTRRSLPATDPDQSQMMVSLGAALENLLIAARAYGLRPAVSHFPNDGHGNVVAEITWSAGDARRDRALFAAIPERRTNRREYDGRGIFMQNRAQLLAQVPEGFELHWIDDRSRIRRLADVVRDATRDVVADRAEQAECFQWMRFGEQERRRGDGVNVERLELGGPARWLAARYFDPKSWFLRFGAQSAAKQARQAVRSAGALVLLTTDRSGPTHWVSGGQIYERFALKATQLGIAQQPMQEAVRRPRHRAEMARVFGTTREPLMFVRLGHANKPPHSMRRGVALVASFRNS